MLLLTYFDNCIVSHLTDEAKMSHTVEFIAETYKHTHG